MILLYFRREQVLFHRAAVLHLNALMVEHVISGHLAAIYFLCKMHSSYQHIYETQMCVYLVLFFVFIFFLSPQLFPFLLFSFT